jgi:two-component system LytT family response regulator
MKLRAVVVDDEELPRQRIQDLVADHEALELVGTAGDGASALDVIVATNPDVVFLDIQMPELTGFEVVAALDKNLDPAIVFVTAYDAYAIQAFEIGAFDYLLKPVTSERFNAAVARVRDRTARGSQMQMVRELADRAARERGQIARLVARRSGKHYLVPIADVEWLESEGNYVRLHTTTGTHLVRRTMKNLETQLDPRKFVRLHRSTIVAIDRIASLQAGDHGEYIVVMKSGARFTSSRNYGQRVRALLG